MLMQVFLFLIRTVPLLWFFSKIDKVINPTLIFESCHQNYMSCRINASTIKTHARYNLRVKSSEAFPKQIVIYV